MEGILKLKIQILLVLVNIVIESSKKKKKMISILKVELFLWVLDVIPNIVFQVFLCNLKNLQGIFFHL